jgi:hypothetical protein
MFFLFLPLRYMNETTQMILSSSNVMTHPTLVGSPAATREEDGSRVGNQVAVWYVYGTSDPNNKGSEELARGLSRVPDEKAPSLIVICFSRDPIHPLCPQPV